MEKGYNDIYALLEENVINQSISDDEVVKGIKEHELFDAVNFDTLILAIQRIVTFSDTTMIQLSSNEEILISELNLFLEAYRAGSISYEDYVDELILIYDRNKNAIDEDNIKSVVIVYGTVYPYWINNLDKWESLNRSGDICPGLPQAAINEAILGCLNGGWQGTLGVIEPGAEACLVVAVMGATGTTLLVAIECAALIIWEQLNG